MRLSTAAQQEHGTFYEFRTYNIRPEQNAAFLKLTNEKIHLRTAHSQLIGYWSVEYGGLNQVFHIWKYGEKVLQLRRSSSISVWTQEVTPFFLPCPLPLPSPQTATPRGRGYGRPWPRTRPGSLSTSPRPCPC